MVEDKEKKDKQPTVAEMKLEDRVGEMHEKADAKTAKFETLAENETDADKKRKYEYKALRAQEKADNKEERMRDRFDFVKDFKESTKAEWDQYVDAFLGTHIVERKKAKADAEAKEKADAEAKAGGQQGSTTTTTLQTPTPPQTPITPPQGEVVITNVAQTPQGKVATTEVQTTGTTPTEVQTNGGVNPTNGVGANNNSTTDVQTNEQTNEPNFAGERASAFERYKTLLKEGNSPYQTLIKNALAKKEEIADRRVRDARSTALSNALGTLTNVLTAGALARKNGTIPIVSAHDKEPDTNLRKSIEGRYQLENENENFLLKLADERRRYEADLANKTYQSELAEINTRQKYYEEQKRREADNAEWDRRETVRQENSLERIDKSATNKSNGGKKPTFSKDTIGIVSAINTHRKVSKGIGKGYKEYNLNDDEIVYLGNLVDEAKAHLNKAEMDYWQKYVGSIWASNELRGLLSNSVIKKVLKDAAEKKVKVEDVIASVEEKNKVYNQQGNNESITK